MKPTLRLILLALIILIFGTVPVVHAVETTAPSFSNAEIVVCGDPAENYSRSIGSSNEIDVYSIELVAGQVLTIDVNTFDNGSILDTVLDVYADTDPNTTDDTEIPIVSNDRSSEVPLNEDPYLEVTAEKDGTYYLVIYAAASDKTGDYSFSLKCTDPSTPTDLPDPVKVGDLLGATDSASGMLLKVNPADATSSIRFQFPSEIGQIADMDYDPVSKMLFVAINDGYPGKVVVFDPDKGTVVGGELLYAEGGFVALEAAGGTLYGVYFYNDDMDVEKYSLVTITPSGNELTLNPVVSLAWPVSSLAYHPSSKIMYGVSGADLIKIDLTSTPVVVEKVGQTGLNEIVALDFDTNNTLYGVDRSGNLFRIPNLDTGQAEKIGPINISDALTIQASQAGSFGVSGLTFVVGDTQDVEPIKTVCSSTITATTTASSETDVHQLARLRLKNNPLHRAIGLFKFQGKAGEKVTLRLTPDGEEAAVTSEESSLNKLFNSCLKSKGQGRVFLSVRDAITNVDFRVRKKDQIPFDMSAELPEDGYYYVMVIRPLLRFYETDYCLTLESDRPDSEAWKTLDVVWPGDDSEENTTSLADEQQLAEPLTDDAGVVAASNAVSEPESTTLINESATVSPVPISTNVTAGETLVESSTEGDNEGGQTAGDINLVAPAAETPKEMTVEATEEATLMDAPLVPEETTLDEPAEVTPVEEPAAEPTMKGAPSIPEETTLDEPGEVAPEKSADQISGDDTSVDGSSSAQVTDDYSDGTGSAEGDTSNVVEGDPPEASKL